MRQNLSFLGNLSFCSYRLSTDGIRPSYTPKVNRLQTVATVTEHLQGSASIGVCFCNWVLQSRQADTSHHLIWFPLAAVMNNHKCRGLKQHTIILTVLEARSPFKWDALRKNQGVSRTVFLPETLGRSLFFAFSRF